MDQQYQKYLGHSRMLEVSQSEYKPEMTYIAFVVYPYIHPRRYQL